jgi:DNA gyrase subunit A
MMENYDSTLQEPQHFLPLIPVALLNPAEGIAVGFAANILPRSLDDIIIAQISYLTGSTNISAPIPKFIPLDNYAHRQEQSERGVAFYFDGEFERIDSTTVKITKIPYGLSHTKVISKLDAEIDKGNCIVDYDDGSRDVINIRVKFKRGMLAELADDAILKMFGLSIRHIENLNVLDFTGQSVWSTNPVDLIQKFCDWRLTWYTKRYERLRDLLQLDIRRYLDIQLAISHNTGGLARDIKSRAELKEVLSKIGIVYIDYIADLPIYRFTEDENQKNEKKLKDANSQLVLYEKILQSDSRRKTIYINELKEVLDSHCKGKYN